MASKTEHAATIAALLLDESHFCQSDPLFRDRYYERTGERYATVPPHVAARDALALIKIGAGVARWAVRECNGHGRQVWHQPSGRWLWTWGEDDALKHRLADQRAEKKANEIAARYGATVKIGGDPRGYTLRLILITGRTNTMGNDGWGIA